MIKLAILTCSEIDENAYNDDNLIISILREQEIEASFMVWDDPETDWSNFDSIIIRSTWDYTEKIEAFKLFINTLPKSIKLFNSKETVLNNIDKSYLFKLKQDGYEIIPSIKKVISPSAIEDAFLELDCSKLIIKPLIGAGASGIQVINKLDDYQKIRSTTEYIIQPFQNSISTDGEVSIIYFNGIYSHAIIKIPKENDFRSQEEFGSNIQSYTPDSATIKYSKNVLESISTETLFARVDLLQNKENEWRYVGEVELIEPALYLSFDKSSPKVFSEAISKRLKSNH